MTAMRARVKQGAALLLSRCGAAAWIGAAARRQPLVLGYHTVVEDARAHAGRAIPANLISVAMLERQLDWIGQRYRFLSLDELAAHVEGGAPLERPAAVVTFDDGYAGVYHHAWPLLRRKGIPAGCFVVTELVGTTRLQLFDKLYLAVSALLPALGQSAGKLAGVLERHGIRLTREPPAACDSFTAMRWLYTACDQALLRHVVDVLGRLAEIHEADYDELHAMTWDMITALDRAGWAIGSHTATHALLTLEEAGTVGEQLAHSAAALQAKLGRRPVHFAYPDGRFDAGVVESVFRHGYRVAYTTCGHRDARHPELTVPRKLLWERSCVDASGRFSADLMDCHASWLFDRLAPCGQSHRHEQAAVLSRRHRAPGSGPARTQHV